MYVHIKQVPETECCMSMSGMFAHTFMMSLYSDAARFRSIVCRSSSRMRTKSLIPRMLRCNEARTFDVVCSRSISCDFYSALQMIEQKQTT